MIRKRDQRGLYAIIPTPALPESQREADGSSVDFTETSRVVDQLIRDGVQGLIALGTTGECATLGDDEYEPVVRCIAAAVAGRVPVFIGATALGVRDVHRRLQILQDAGVDGTLLGLPMWQPLSVDMAVAFYRDVSRVFPTLPVMVYANERAFRFPFSKATEFWAALPEQAPTVSSAKFSAPGAFARLREATGGSINFMPNDMRVGQFFDIAGADVTSCWATAASMGPEPCLALMDAVLASDTASMAAITRDINWSNEPIEDLLRDPTVFASYNIQIERVRINAAGYCESGPIRPPYDTMPNEYREMAQECGERWRSLRDKYSARLPTA